MRREVPGRRSSGDLTYSRLKGRLSEKWIEATEEGSERGCADSGDADLSESVSVVRDTFATASNRILQTGAVQW